MSSGAIVSSGSSGEQTKTNQSHRILVMTGSVIDKLALQLTLTQLRLKHLLNIAMSPHEVMNLIADEIEES